MLGVGGDAPAWLGVVARLGLRLAQFVGNCRCLSLRSARSISLRTDGASATRTSSHVRSAYLIFSLPGANLRW